MEIPESTQVILLLTAPLLTGAGHIADVPKPLTTREYESLARHLAAQRREPADLLSQGDLLSALSGCEIDESRIRRLLQRGVQLAQAIARWQSYGIWVISREDSDYPKRLKERLKSLAPPILYGSGDRTLLNGGGLAIVGSRQVDEDLLEYASRAGELAARAGRIVISGGARGIDQAAMRGALQAGGRAVGVLADSLARVTVNREHRDVLRSGCLVLISPYDPIAGFDVGNSMGRNKLIYALSDVALVVNSDLSRGGTWAGAVEQLDRFHFVPLFVRSTGTPSEGLRALREKGAFPAPDLQNEETFIERLFVPPESTTLFDVSKGHDDDHTVPVGTNDNVAVGRSDLRLTGVRAQRFVAVGGRAETTAAEDLFAKVRELILQMLMEPMERAEVAQRLGVTQGQAEIWLERLESEGEVRTVGKKPRKYVAASQMLLRL